MGSYIDTVNAAYIICMSIGILLSIVALIFGSGHGALHGTDGSLSHTVGHIGHDGGSLQMQDGTTSNVVPLLNINALFAFLIGFGAAGLISYGILRVTILSLIPAVIMGAIFWYAVRKVLSAMLKGQSKFLTTSLEDIIGVNGTVSSGLSDQRLGEVIYTIEGNTRAIPAKHKHPGEVQKGENVVIIAIVEGVALIIREDRFNLEL